jgi:hypothetical protein
MGLDVEAIFVGKGREDSMMATAAWEVVIGEAEDAPRTTTCRFVDFKAEKRWDGDAGMSQRNAVELSKGNAPLPVIVTRFFSRSMSYRSIPDNLSVVRHTAKD